MVSTNEPRSVEDRLNAIEQAIVQMWAIVAASQIEFRTRSVVIVNTKGTPVAAIHVNDETGGGQLCICNGEGKPVAIVNADTVAGAGQVIINDAAGRSIAGLQASPDGSGRIVAVNPATGGHQWIEP